MQEQLSATIVDVLQVANWQRANAGQKTSTSKPKPIPRPGITPDRNQLGTSAVPLEEAQEIFVRRNPAAFN